MIIIQLVACVRRMWWLLLLLLLVFSLVIPDQNVDVLVLLCSYD